MQTNFNADGSLTLAAWSLVDLVVGVAQCTKDGYELDVDSNEYYPQQLGGLFTVTFSPNEKAVVPITVPLGTEVKPTETAEVPKDTEVVKESKNSPPSHKEHKKKK